MSQLQGTVRQSDRVLSKKLELICVSSCFRLPSATPSGPSGQRKQEESSSSEWEFSSHRDLHYTDLVALCCSLLLTPRVYESRNGAPLSRVGPSLKANKLFILYPELIKSVLFFLHLCGIPHASLMASIIDWTQACNATLNRPVPQLKLANNAANGVAVSYSTLLGRRVACSRHAVHRF